MEIFLSVCLSFSLQICLPDENKSTSRGGGRGTTTESESKTVGGGYWHCGTTAHTLNSPSADTLALPYGNTDFILFLAPGFGLAWPQLLRHRRERVLPHFVTMPPREGHPGRDKDGGKVSWHILWERTWGEALTGF